MARKTPVYNFTINQGEDWELPLVWKDSAGTPIDVTGYSARLVARADVVTDPILIDISSPSSGITVGTTDGLFTLALTNAETAALTFDKAKYQLEITSPASKVTRLLQGQITLSTELVV